MDKHTTHIIDRNPRLQEQQTNIRQMLQSMLENGMMLSANNKPDSLKNNETPSSIVKNRAAPVVAIMTCDRPEALERLLKSVATNCDTIKSRCLYVVDDSRKTENIAQNQAVVKKLQPQIESEVYYIESAQHVRMLQPAQDKHHPDRFPGNCPISKDTS